jgi:hypothetical protein
MRKQNTEYRIQNTETEDRRQKTDERIQNTKYREKRVQRKNLYSVFCIFSFVLFITACSAGAHEIPTDTSISSVSASAVTEAASGITKPIAAGDGYTFEFSDSNDNYIITAQTTDTDIIFTVEDRFYNVSTCVDSLPEGFSPGVPGPKNCRVLSDRFMTEPKHDLLQVLFTDVSGGGTVVSKIYGIRDGILTPLENYDNTVQTLQYTETIPDSVLLPAEPNKYIPAPEVIYTENGGTVVSVYSYTFDPNTMTFTKATERISADNPLYYGYAAMAVCNDLYSYFSDKTLAVHSDNPIPILTNTGLEETVFFFPVDDPRFSTLTEFEGYMRRFFSDEIVTEMFRSAPQKYRDIDGVLCTAQVNTLRNASLGGVVITDYAVEDINIVYSTEQFSETDGITALTNSGDFIIETLQSPGWKAVQYKYPYR